EGLAIAPRDPAGDLQELMHRHDVPECGIDRVELELLAVIREAIRQHPFGDGSGPFEEDRTGIVQPAGREAEPAECDELVPAPVAEPRVPGDDRLAGSAPDQVRIGRAVEARGEAPAATPLDGAKGRDVLRRLVSLRGEYPDRLAACQVPAEHARRREILH